MLSSNPWASSGVSSGLLRRIISSRSARCSSGVFSRHDLLVLRQSRSGLPAFFEHTIPSLSVLLIVAAAGGGVDVGVGRKPRGRKGADYRNCRRRSLLHSLERTC